MIDNIYILGSKSCYYYQRAMVVLKSREKNNMINIKMVYEQESMSLYKEKLKVLKKNLKSLKLSKSARDKLNNMKTSPIIIIPRRNFVGGLDEYLTFSSTDGDR